MTIADGSDVLASDILAIKQNAQTAFDMAQNALSDATDALAAATAALAAAEGAYPATGGVIDGVVTIGAGAKNSLTITPGATATGVSDSIVFEQSGKGGFQFGSATTARLFIGPGSTPGSGVQISTDGSTGTIGLFAESFLFGFPLISNFISVTLGNGSVPIQFDTIPTGPGIRFSEQIGVGNSASGHNVLTILPGATASAPIVVKQSGTGGLALPAISAPLMELLDPATAIRVGTYLDQNDALNIGLPASGTTIASRFTFNAGGTLTADTGNIATAATITSGTPLTAGTITTDNTGVTAGQAVLLTTPTPVTVGGVFSIIWVTATGVFTANMTVKTSVVSGTTRTIGAVGTVSGSPLTANGITFTAIYSQPGGAGTTISVSYNVVTNYSGAPWLTVGPTAIKIGSGAQTTFTVTPVRAVSAANARVSPTTPCFAAQ